LDLSGRLVGVNTAIFTNTGASAGVGFALPAETAARVVPQLIADGRVTRPSLGIIPAADPVARALGATSGVLIQTVDPSGPAAAAGLLPTRRGLSGVIGGDVIVRIGSQPVRSLFDLSAALDAAAVGDVVEIEALRGVGGSGNGGPEHVVLKVTLAAE
jgi:S1-C subfamily serine protease